MSVLGKKWCVKNKESELPLLERLLRNRGLTEVGEVTRFLNPNREKDFHDPFLMDDMTKAVERITKAIEQKERIMIFGDYDVDGITGSAILFRALRTLGAQVSCRLPHRIEDGYGLRNKFIEEFKELGVGLIITVDNGISCADQVDFALSHGIETIISDHHTVPERLPNAVAILHPKLPKASYPCTELTGAGVALKLAQALLSALAPESELINDLFDLAAMGTIADMGELRGENRLIVKEGLQRMQHTRWPGLSRLKKYAGVSGVVNTEDIGFMICPRINAAGRIADPMHAFRLLIHDGQQSDRLAYNLDQLNQQRQTLMQQLFILADVQAATQTALPATVIWDKEFHGGIIGLIAARLCDKYQKPAIVMEQRKDILIGSCRSVAGVNIVEALAAVKHTLTAFGGHSAAAGFEVSKKNLNDFVAALSKVLRKTVRKAPTEFILDIDCELSHAEVADKTVEAIKTLQPFGVGNSAPLFLCRNITIIDPSTVGKEKKHLKFKSTINGLEVDVIGFKFGEFYKELRQGMTMDVVGQLEHNIWRGRKRLQLKLTDFALRN
ncbi:single-stranded-DNA-specific exonuclease RecJ [Candidatus Peregrinibacteria bacterium CG_4_9_14_0_2_um_filter_53_11]|nr:MAG: single-stranded-DNA-specific exonuclease RecJ [Candidatus Peregrinibacteria bacterium CG_4_9_14_0_2_um_filter_53_11]